MNPVKAATNRAEAIAAGKKRYLGLACTVKTLEHGIDSGAVRYVHSNRCCKCDHERVTAFRQERKRNS